MKSERTIHQHLRALRRVIEDESTDLVTCRIAYEIETAIRWAREDTVGWPRPVQMARDAAHRLKRDMAP